MKPYQIAMVLALAGAAGLALFGDKTPSSDVAEAVVRQPRAGTPAVAARSGKAESSPKEDVMILRLQPRALLIGDAADGFGPADSIFGGQSWNPPPPPPPPPSNAPPPPPMAPPLPFAYIGKAAADGAWEVYLSRADKVYVVRLKTVIDNTYRVDAITPPMMTLTYLPLNQVQQLNIGVLD